MSGVGGSNPLTPTNLSSFPASILNPQVSSAVGLSKSTFPEFTFEPQKQIFSNTKILSNDVSDLLCFKFA